MKSSDLKPTYQLIYRLIFEIRSPERSKVIIILEYSNIPK